MGYVTDSDFGDAEVAFAIDRTRRALKSTIEIARPAATRLLADLRSMQAIDDAVVVIQQTGRMVTLMTPHEARRFVQAIPEAHHLLGRLSDSTGTAASRTLLHSLDNWFCLRLPSYTFRQWVQSAGRDAPEAA